MKSNFKFSAFIPVLTSPAVFDWLRNPNVEPETVERFGAQDPAATAWRSSGLCNTFNGHMLHTIEPGKWLMQLQFNERILPGKVRDEFLSKRVAEFDEREGRKPGKKDYAMLKEEVEFELLPKAFIRRSQVPVIFLGKQRMVLIGTSSPKRADEVMALLHGFFDNMCKAETHWFAMSPENNVVEGLGIIAKDGLSVDNESNFFIGDSAVLRGTGKQTIRIKDKDIGGHDVQELLKQKYDVHELGFNYDPNGNEDEPLASFTFSDKVVFKRLKLTDGVARVEYGTVETTEQQTEAVIWLTARTAQEIVVNLMGEFGGYKNYADMKKEHKAEEKAATKANTVDPLNDEDDEEL